MMENGSDESNKSAPKRQPKKKKKKSKKGKKEHDSDESIAVFDQGQYQQQQQQQCLEGAVGGVENVHIQGAKPKIKKQTDEGNGLCKKSQEERYSNAQHRWNIFRKKEKSPQKIQIEILTAFSSSVNPTYNPNDLVQRRNAPIQSTDEEEL
jgi:hypothetical protein